MVSERASRIRRACVLWTLSAWGAGCSTAWFARWTGSRSSGTGVLLFIQILCSHIEARTIFAHFWGSYCRYPPDFDRARNLDFSRPNACSTSTRVRECTRLKFSWAWVAGAAYGVIRWGSNGYPESPEETFLFQTYVTMLAWYLKKYSFLQRASLNEIVLECSIYPIESIKIRFGSGLNFTWKFY